MIELTQSDTGNCWQTAVACILELNPEEMPSQMQIEAEGKYYSNYLNCYLIKHHDRFYFELEGWQCVGLMVREPGWHCLTGPTIRTPENHVNHVVVARYGEPVWDPHPSRAGLTQVKKWGLVVPYRNQWDTMAQNRPDDFACHCPACRAIPIAVSPEATTLKELP